MAQPIDPRILAKMKAQKAMASKMPAMQAQAQAAPTPPAMGGMMKKGGKVKKMAEGGMADAKDDKKMMKEDEKEDKKLIKKAFGMHDKQEHKGQHTNLSSLKKGGGVKKMAKGGMAEVMGPKTMSKDVEAGSNKLKSFGESKVQKRGDTKGKNLGDSGPTRMCGGGMKKMARGGGIESKGKTKGKYI